MKMIFCTLMSRPVQVVGRTHRTDPAPIVVVPTPAGSRKSISNVVDELPEQSSPVIETCWFATVEEVAIMFEPVPTLVIVAKYDPPAEVKYPPNDAILDPDPNE